MNYNFDTVWQREGHDAMKWEFPRYPMSSVYTKAENFIPMWVADMDFATPDFVLNAIKERMDHPILGYFALPQRYIEAVKKWQKTRFNVDYPFTRSEIMYQNSVLGGVASFLSAYTMPGENVLINSATYTGFQGTITNLGRNICSSPLIKDENGIFRLDFEDMENKIISKKINVYIFCSPHNPSGRVWERWEIEKVVELCSKYDVKIVSDEIWADFVLDKTVSHIPTQSVNETAKNITMALYAPSKTFNIAGLVGAYSIIYNKQMANKVAACATATHYNGPNILSCYGLIGGYENGAEWVDKMNLYILENMKLFVEHINSHYKGVKAYIPQATYLLWVDFTQCGTPVDDIFKKLLEVGVLPNNGKTFLQEGYLRFNMACPRSLCEEALSRMDSVLIK